MTIIGITGKAGSGKDTAAAALERHYNFEVVHFSDALKAGLAAMFSWDPAQLDGSQREWREAPYQINGVLIPSPRYMMQTIGTEWGRQMIHPDIWVLATHERIRQSCSPHFVISDVRFNNEAEWIIAQGGLVVEVERPGLSGAAGSHVSEVRIDEEHIFETYINNGSIEALESWIVATARWKLGLTIF